MSGGIEHYQSGPNWFQLKAGSNGPYYVVVPAPLDSHPVTNSADPTAPEPFHPICLLSNSPNKTHPSDEAIPAPLHYFSHSSSCPSSTARFPTRDCQRHHRGPAKQREPDEAILWNCRDRGFGEWSPKDTRVDSVTWGPDGQPQHTLLNDQANPLPQGFSGGGSLSRNASSRRTTQGTPRLSAPVHAAVRRTDH